MKQALVYQPDDGAYLLLSGLMKQLGIRERRIAGKELSEPLYRLLGLPAAFTEPQGRSLSPLQTVPALTVLFGFRGEELDGFLQARKNAGLSGVGLLAVVTPDNISWSMGELGIELQREHEEILKRRP